MKFPFCICLFPLVFALFHPALAEGNNGSLDFEQRINGKAVLKTIEPIRERLQDLSAVFFSGHDVVIYGIVLSPDGYIATKASEQEALQRLQKSGMKEPQPGFLPSSATVESLSLKNSLHHPNSLKAAVLYQEILGKPRALRSAFFSGE